LAQREDLVALALAWQGPGDKIDLRCRLYMPEDGIDEKAHAWRAPLHQWIEEGWITVLPGRSIPIDYLRYEISGVGLNADGSICKQRSEKAIAEQFVIKELAFDRALSKTLVYQWLAETDGIECTEHGQGFMDMSPAAKAFQDLVASRRLRHDGNPVLDWMVGHCIVTMDPAGNIKPDKRQSRQKIDGLVAAVMAVSRVLNAKPKANSVYARRGVLVI
jgi:phage terminase large subunit-like protein